MLASDPACSILLSLGLPKAVNTLLLEGPFREKCETGAVFT